MPTVEFEGQTHIFPDDFTDAEIAKALGKASPLPAGMSATRQQYTGQDLPRLHGSDITMGVPGAAERQMGAGRTLQQILMDSLRGPAMGAATALPIMTAGASIPVQAAVMGASGAAQSKLQGGSNLEAGISGAIGAGLGGLPAILPSTLKSKAGSALANFVQQFSRVPIDHSAPANIALEAYDASQAGATLPKVFRNFLTRLSAPDAAPMTVSEARRFASAASSQSIKEVTAQNANMQRLVGQFAGAMHGAIGDATNPGQYQQLLRDYSNAAALGNQAQAVKQYLPKLAAAAGLGAAGAAGYKFMHGR